MAMLNLETIVRSRETGGLATGTPAAVIRWGGTAKQKEARDVLPRQLAARGARVEVLPLYRTVIPSTARGPSSVWSADVVTFTSASTARFLIDEGFTVTVQPTDFTIPALADAIIGYFARQPGLE